MSALRAPPAYRGQGTDFSVVLTRSFGIAHAEPATPRCHCALSAPLPPLFPFPTCRQPHQPSSPALTNSLALLRAPSVYQYSCMQCKLELARSLLHVSPGHKMCVCRAPASPGSNFFPWLSSSAHGGHEGAAHGGAQEGAPHENGVR
jgi:hypothetical protein